MTHPSIVRPGFNNQGDRKHARGEEMIIFVEGLEGRNANKIMMTGLIDNKSRVEVGGPVQG